MHICTIGCMCALPMNLKEICHSLSYTELVLILRKSEVLCCLIKRSLVSYWPHVFWKEVFIRDGKIYTVQQILSCKHLIQYAMYDFVHFCVLFSACITLKGVVVILLCFIIKIICFLEEETPLQHSAWLYYAWWITPTDELIFLQILNSMKSFPPQLTTDTM